MSDEGMTAAGRAALEFLARRHMQAIPAARIAEWNGDPLPKVQAGLMWLRSEGFVRYFSGHPGTWAVTPSGVGEIDAVDASIQRYRMALESILIVTETTSSSVAIDARKIARRALGAAVQPHGGGS